MSLVIDIRWRRVPESNRSTRICNPLHNLPAHSPLAAQYTMAEGGASHPVVDQPLPQRFFCGMKRQTTERKSLARD